VTQTTTTPSTIVECDGALDRLPRCRRGPLALAESRKTLPVAIGRRNDTFLRTPNGRLGNYLRGESPFGTGAQTRVVLNSEREDIVLHEFSTGDDFQIPPRQTDVVMASRDFKVATLACVRPLFKICRCHRMDISGNGTQ
jgi:hypothetical protein